jgi:hypothetical protein
VVFFVINVIYFFPARKFIYVESQASSASSLASEAKEQENFKKIVREDAGKLLCAFFMILITINNVMR